MSRTMVGFMIEGSGTGSGSVLVTDGSAVYLDERPAGGRVHEPHNGGQAALQPHSVLGHFALRVPENIN